jgi:type IV secretory pathway VirB2 component (pilin)
MEEFKNMKTLKRPDKKFLKYALLFFLAWLAAVYLALMCMPRSGFAQVVGGSTQILANPLNVQQFFDSAAFFLIKTVGAVVGMIAIAVAVFAAKFGRGSFGNIASVCFYIGLLFLAPSIVQLLSLFAGIGF